MVKFSNVEVDFDHKYLPINDLRVETVTDSKTGKKTVSSILVQDEPVQPSPRFWTSLFARYSFNKSFFRYFDYAEVFERISKRESNDRMRVCIERSKHPVTGGDMATLMAVSKPTRPIVAADELSELLTRYDSESLIYSGGIVESMHKPRAGAQGFEVLGDKFENRFAMQTPVDGYGAPNLYLSLLRLACSNGMIGYAKTFRTSLSLGKGNDVMPTITRALDSFNSDDGFAAIRNRVESSGQSWLSVYEAEQLRNMLYALHSNKQLIEGSVESDGNRVAEYLAVKGPTRNEGAGGLGPINSKIMKSFEAMTGDTRAHYGLANMDSLSAKRQRTLPTNCKVYDALNFATEVATHYSEPKASRKLQAWVGQTISDEYDIEGTVSEFEEFSDFLVDSKLKNQMTGSQNVDSSVPVLSN